MANESVYIGWLGPMQFVSSAGSIAFGGSILPTVDNAYDLGSSTFRWKSIYWGTQALGPDGSASAPSYSFASSAGTGWWLGSSGTYLSASYAGTRVADLNATGFFVNGLILDESNADVKLVRAAPNIHAWKNGTNAQAGRYYGYESGSRATYESIASVTTAVTLSGATSSTGNVIPAGATVVDVATTTTTTITGASGYQVGDGSDADRYGDITGTAVGTASGSTNYTADPRWWTAAARAITLTAKTSNFTGGVAQVTVFYRSATGA